VAASDQYSKILSKNIAHCVPDSMVRDTEVRHMPTPNFPVCPLKIRAAEVLPVWSEIREGDRPATDRMLLWVHSNRLWTTHFPKERQGARTSTPFPSSPLPLRFPPFLIPKAASFSHSAFGIRRQTSHPAFYFHFAPLVSSSPLTHFLLRCLLDLPLLHLSTRLWYNVRVLRPRVKANRLDTTQ
jgi:hypothetical protein